MDKTAKPSSLRNQVLAALALASGVTALGASLVARADQRADAPTYSAQICCNLCPRAADPEAYATPFFKAYRTLVEGRDGWLFRSEVDLATSLVPEDEKIYEDLGRLYRALKARGTEVIFFSSPLRGLVEARQLKPGDRERYDYNGALKSYGEQLQKLRDVGFIVPDYTKFANEPEGDDFFFHRDVHWRASGARRTAELIAEKIKALKLDVGLPPKPYETRLIGVGRTQGQMPRVAAGICGGQYPQEILPRYETTVSSSGDLFGDEAAPEVVLVGTSMSGTNAYNFGGFLQSLLKTDIYNVAISGGNLDGAMTQYLMSDAYQKHPPKLMIWEVPNQQIVQTRHALMRRLVPLVSNGCAGRSPLLSGTVTLKTGDDLADVLYNGGVDLVTNPARDMVMDLQFDDPNVKEILTEFWYLNGGHEVLRAHYNDFTNARGRFVLELSRDPEFADQALVDFRVQVITQLEKPTSVKAQLCSVKP